MNIFKKRNAKGFTLIELLVVIAIIGILASIISVSLTSARAKSRDAKRVADIRSVQLALEQYYNDNGYYPTTMSGLAPTYISTIPKDPTNNTTSYMYSSYNPAIAPNCLGKATNYHLAAVMESDNTTNASLNQDVDWSPTGYTVCTGSTANFHGYTAACSGTTQGALDGCYDQITN